MHCLVRVDIISLVLKDSIDASFRKAYWEWKLTCIHNIILMTYCLMWTVNYLHAVKVNFIVCIICYHCVFSGSQMTLRPRGHSYDVPRVVYDLTKRSFILRSLYKQSQCYCNFLIFRG